MRKEKVPFDVDKRTWHPSPLLGQIVLVTTLNENGQSNVAPKSWISMMVSRPPMLALGCNLDHWTARNILRNGKFVVNIPGDDLADTAWKSGALPHPRPVEAAGLTPLPAERVRAPRIEECRAHLECVLERHLTFGKEVVILGRIVAVSTDREALENPDPYSYLRLFTFLEAGTYGAVEKSIRLSCPGSERAQLR
jgi:flavin reductase (DIM6/NTAB) family NADH-FMN oxidoreductase RutF